MSSKKLGMWLFIASDSLTFAALLIAYGYLRHDTAVWPHPFPVYPTIIFAAAMTVILLVSSLTMRMAIMAARRSERKTTALWVLATIACGLAFIGMHLHEWLSLIGGGVTMTHDPWGIPLFGAVFFSVTGLHMAHVFVGLLYLGIVATGFGRGKFSIVDVEVSGIYWQFVNVVWLVIFPLIYMTSIKR